MESRKAAQDAIVFLRKYAQIRANTLLANRLQCLPPTAFLELGRRGLLGLCRDTEVGGAGLRQSDALKVLEQLAAIDLSSALAVGLHNFLSSPLLIDHSHPELRKVMEPDLASGRTLGCFALTEPGAGSDPRRITASAHVQLDGTWRISGHKIWAGVSAWAGWGVIFARAHDFSNRDQGITAFAVPMDAAGISHGFEAETLGMKGVVQSEFFLDEVVVPEENLLGQVGEGLEIAQKSMMFSRLICCVLAAGAMKRAIQILGRYVERRTISTGSMSDNPVVADIFAQETARTRGVSLFVELAGEMLDEGAPLSPFVLCAAKVVAPEEAFLTIDRSLQLLGGRGYVEANILPRLLRDARAIRLFEGPTEAIASHLGSLAILKRDDLEAQLAAWGARDVWAELEPVLALANPGHPENIHADRWQLIRLQQQAGQITAAALFFAGVRKQAGMEDHLAVKLRKDSFCELLLAPYKTEAWAEKDEAWKLWKKMDREVGQVDETRGGFESGMDPLIQANPPMA